MVLAAQSISHYISLAWGIRNTHIVICYSFHPSLLTEIQIWLSKQILQTLVICVNLATVSNKVLPPLFQCMNYCGKFKVMNWVVLFMRMQLTGCISNHSALLH